MGPDAPEGSPEPMMNLITHGTFNFEDEDSSAKMNLDASLNAPAKAVVVKKTSVKRSRPENSEIMEPPAKRVKLDESVKDKQEKESKKQENENAEDFNTTEAVMRDDHRPK